MKKFIKPFVYLSAGATMLWGALGLAAMVLAAWYFGVTFRGVVSQGIGHLSLWQLALQQVAGWGVFAALLYAAGRLFSKSRIRVVEVFGNQLMSRMPLILILLGTTLSPIREMGEQLMSMTPDQIAQAPELVDQINVTGLTVFGFAALAVLVWFFAWSYQGYAVAVNLKGWRAAGSYIVCYLIAELAATACTAAIAGW